MRSHARVLKQYNATIFKEVRHFNGTYIVKIVIRRQSLWQFSTKQHFGRDRFVYDLATKEHKTFILDVQDTWCFF